MIKGMPRAAQALLPLLVVAALWGGWQYARPVPTLPPPAVATAAPVVLADDGEQPQAAALATAPAVAGVQQRPDFVSVVEWEVLRALAARHATPAAELDRLVNQLRFNKQLAWWQEESSAAPALRRQVAEALLSALPARVAAGDIALSDARAVQQDVLLAIEPDAGRRADRLAREGERIGIVQAIQPVH